MEILLNSRCLSNQQALHDGFHATWTDWAHETFVSAFGGVRYESWGDVVQESCDICEVSLSVRYCERSEKCYFIMRVVDRMKRLNYLYFADRDNQSTSYIVAASSISDAKHLQAILALAL